MKLIVGLGNPTKEYDKTRHNVGFDTIDKLMEIHKIPYKGVNHKAMIGTGYIGHGKVLLAKPLTYMNRSGESVRAMVDYYKLDPEEDLVVIYDDISLAPGQLRVRAKGSAGGHNGIKSLIQYLATQNFPRVRIGIGEKPEGWDLADYVLGHFSKDERKMVDEAIDMAAGAVEKIFTENIQAAMNEYNRKGTKQEL